MRLPYGTFVPSPKKATKAKTQLNVLPVHLAARKAAAQQKLRSLYMQPAPQKKNDDVDDIFADDGDDQWEEIGGVEAETGMDTAEDIPQPTQSPRDRTRRTDASSDDLSLASRWKALLPKLVDPYLKFVAGTMSRVGPLPVHNVLRSTCTTSACIQKTAAILCLYQDRA